MYWQRKRRGKRCYCNEVIYFDCETSNNHAADLLQLKTWIVSIQVRFNGEYYLFRKPTEFTDWLRFLIKEYKLDPERRILCLAHNASYDLSYLVPWLQQELPNEPRSGIYEGLSKIINYSQYCFDFYCSYMLTGKSLAKWSKELNVEHKKQVGLYDYDKILYQDSELSEDEQTYDMYDVLALEECYKKQLQLHGDTTATVPLTKTGYVRRRFRRGSQKDKDYRKKYFRDTMLSVDQYKMALWSFAGGYVHNNRYFKSKLVKWYLGIGHADFRSHYPTQAVDGPLPVGKPETYYDYKHKLYKDFPHSPVDFVDMWPEYFSLVHVRIYGAVLKYKGITIPFLQASKLFNLTKKGDKLGKFRSMDDNGRVMKILSGACETVMDNLTLSIILKQYHVKMIVLRAVRWKCGPLPDCLADTIHELFKQKSDLKILHNEMVEKYGIHSNEAIEAAFNLSQSKADLNGCYGMFATRPAREEYDLDYSRDPPLVTIKGCGTDAEIQEQLDKFYKSSNSFLAYIIGIAICAKARYELFEFIEAVGYNNILYADTDSLFYLKTQENVKAIKRLNALKHKTAPYIVNSEGKRIYYNVFEDESDIIAFKGLHSKCYGYVTTKNELVLTIAGIPAFTLIGMKDEKPVYLTREEELAGITPEQKLQDPNIKIKDPVVVLDRLTDETTFHVNTGTAAHYLIEEPHTEIINGHEIELAGGCVRTKLKEKKIFDLDIEDFTIDYSYTEEGYDII